MDRKYDDTPTAREETEKVAAYLISFQDEYVKGIVVI
jgi:hypothetical protein